MKAQPHELDLINREGYVYCHFPKRGWYYKSEWVGYNVKDVFNDRANRFGYNNETMESSRIPGR